MGGLAGCRGGGGHLSLVVLVSEKPNLVSEKSGKSQGILLICGAGNPVNDHHVETTCRAQHLGRYFEGQGHSMTFKQNSFWPITF